MLPTWSINVKADQLDTPCHSSKKNEQQESLDHRWYYYPRRR